MMLLVNEKHSLIAEHVKSHTAQPQNEFADSLATAFASTRFSFVSQQGDVVRDVAAFEGYDSLWLHFVAGSMIPPIHQDCMLLPQVDEDRAFQPDLAKTQDCRWTTTSQTRTARLDICAVTYNVLSLRHCDPTGLVDSDSVFPGKTKYLAKQILDAGVHVAALQECRTAQNGIFENQNLIRIVAAGLPDGTLGTEVWLNKRKPFGSSGKDTFHFAKNMLLVIHADPRMLVVKIRLPERHLLVISGHCPHSLDEQLHREEWWTRITRILKQTPPTDLVICGCDFNSRLPETVLPHVGDLLCAKGNPNTPAFLAFLKDCNLVLPSTFSDMHNGPQDTWRHSSGKTARLDYVAVRHAAWDSMTSSAWPHLDAGNAIPDHSAVSLRLQLSWSSYVKQNPMKMIDWEQVRAPQNRDQVCNLIASIPVAPWKTMPTKQMQDLHQNVTQILSEHFPMKRTKPRKPYITEETWKLRLRRKNLLRSLRLLRLHQLQADQRMALRVWATSLADRNRSSIAELAIVPLLTKLTLASVKTTAKALRLRLRADKANFVADISLQANEANGSEIFRSLAPLRVGSRFSKRSIEPLPMWRKQDGELAQSFEDRLDVWRTQCSDLEAGHLTTPAELLGKALDRARQRRENLPPLSFDEIPTVLQLEAKLRSIKRNKTAGNDGLKSDVFALAAPQFARHLFSMSTKLMVIFQEPLISKGGTLVAAFKGSGAADQVANYRSLIFYSYMGKALRSFWRTATMPLYESLSSNLHLSGKKGGNVSHASMVLRSLLSGADSRNRSSSVIFLDISSAYYRVVREFVVHETTTDEELVRILQRFNLPPEEYALLWQHLQQPDILSQVNANPRHRAILDELLTSTWFTVPGDAQVVATQAGSRPGDNLADIIFAFVYSRLLEHLRLALQDEGFRTFQQTELTDDLRSLYLQPVDIGDTPHLCDVTWADDLAIFLQHPRAEDLVARTKLTTGLLFDLCWRKGLLPNLKKGKTEAIVKLKGPNSKPLRRELYGMPEPFLSIPSTLRDDVRLRLVHKYRHLGHQIPFTFKQDDEVRSRVALARAAYAKHRRTVFQNRDISLKTRARLLHSLVISILSYNQGTWLLLSSKSWQHFSGAILGFYRGLIRGEIGRDTLLTWSDSRVLAFVGLPGPQDLLHLARLRYAGSLWRSAPLEVWWATHFSGKWFAALDNAIGWLNENTKGLDVAAGAQWRKEHWHEIIANAKQWKMFLRKAMQHSVETHATLDHLHRWHYEFLERSIELGLTTEAEGILRRGLAADAPRPDEVHPHACIQCQETFTTFAAWSVHANRKHGRVAPERLLLDGTACLVCCKEYHTSCRLLRHLRHSQRCAAFLQGQQPCMQAVRPGIGNTHVDRDRPLPLPVCPLTDELPLDLGAIEPIPVRTEHSRTLTSHLLQAFDAWIIQPERDEESFLDSCFVMICETIEPIFILQNTLEHLVNLFVHDEMQMLHRVAHGETGTRIWTKLRLLIEVPTLVPTQSSKLKPHHINGAAFAGLHQCRFQHFRWDYVKQIPRARSKELLILHLFSGHRREGDLSNFLADLPAPDNALITTLALDIIFDHLRCDLSRASTQRQWLDYAKAGAILGFVAGPPCESWSAARTAGGKAGSHWGDGGPRQIRSWSSPFGLDATTPDERAHIRLANSLLLFSVDMALEMIPSVSFFLLEHPGIPENAKGRDLPTIWETGPLRVLRAHPATSFVEILQGRFGAKSPKPTVFVTKGLETLPTHLARQGTCALPKALRLGKTEGVYNTASLKEYPPKLCRAIGDSVADFVGTLAGYGTSYTLHAPARETWVREIQKNQNFSAQMGADRAGAGL